MNHTMKNGLTDGNRALLQRALGQTFWEPNDAWIWLSAADVRDLNALLNAAREEGRQSAPSPAVGDREAIARIIEPEAGWDDLYAYPSAHRRRESSLAKADAILALSAGGGSS